MRVIKLFLEGTLRLIPVVLAGDLLYLYYVGAWYDPFKWIEVAEVILLYLVIIGSIIYTVLWVKERTKGVNIKQN